MMEGLAIGRSVTIVTGDEKEISPQVAAGLLGVSRPFASTLFDDGLIPSRRVALTGERSFVTCWRIGNGKGKPGNVSSTNSPLRASVLTWATDEWAHRSPS